MKTFYLQFDDIELQIKERSEHFHFHSIIRIMGYVSWLLLRRISLANYNGLFHLVSDSPKDFFWWFTPPPKFLPANTPLPAFCFLYPLRHNPPSISFRNTAAFCLLYPLRHTPPPPSKISFVTTPLKFFSQPPPHFVLSTLSGISPLNFFRNNPPPHFVFSAFSGIPPPLIFFSQQPPPPTAFLSSLPSAIMTIIVGQWNPL